MSNNTEALEHLLAAKKLLDGMYGVETWCGLPAHALREAIKAVQHRVALEGTLWYRKNQDGEWEFNHLEDGHAEGPFPTVKHPAHAKVWSSGAWKSEKVWLSTDKARVVTRDPTKLDPLGRIKKDK